MQTTNIQHSVWPGQSNSSNTFLCVQMEPNGPDPFDSNSSELTLRIALCVFIYFRPALSQNQTTDLDY